MGLPGFSSPAAFFVERTFMAGLRDLQNASRPQAYGGGNKEVTETKQEKPQLESTGNTGVDAFYEGVSNVNDWIDKTNYSVGKAIDDFLDPILGSIGNNTFAEATTPEMYASAVDALEYLIPGVGAVKGAVQASPEWYKAIHGVDPETGEQLDGGQRFWSGADAALSTALGFIPGIGGAGKVGKAAAKESTKAAKAGAKAATETAETAAKEAATEAVEKAATNTAAEAAKPSRFKQALKTVPEYAIGKTKDVGANLALGGAASATGALANGEDPVDTFASIADPENPYRTQNALRLAAIMAAPGGRFATNFNRSIRKKPILQRTKVDPSLAALKALQFNNVFDDVTSNQGE